MDPTVTSVLDSLSTLGPAGVVGGAWIWSMLRQNQALRERVTQLEDRNHDMLKDLSTRRRAFDWAGHQHKDKDEDG